LLSSSNRRLTWPRARSAALEERDPDLLLLAEIDLRPGETAGRRRSPRPAADVLVAVLEHQHRDRVALPAKWSKEVLARELRDRRRDLGGVDHHVVGEEVGIRRSATALDAQFTAPVFGATSTETFLA